MDKELIRKLAEYSRELVYGMRERVNRLPDAADFEAGFKIVVEKYEKGQDEHHGW